MIKSKEEFSEFVKNIETQNWYRKPLAFGIAKVDRGQKNSDKILQAIYPIVNWNENFGSGAIFLNALGTPNLENSEAIFDLNISILEQILDNFAPFIAETKDDKHQNIQVIQTVYKIIKKEPLKIANYKMVFIFSDEVVKSVEVAYLKLFALSLKKVKPRTINLNGIFGILSNVAWCGNSPIELDYLRDNKIEMQLNGTYPNIDYVDKFPRYLMHIIPEDNVRILDSSKVRFGAYIGAGTTVMPGASYVNFNAGTLGAVMVEGRVSSSAVVDSGSDIGGGASILGVLSGTDGIPNSIGKNTLLGANSTLGISLGDGCIVDAGVTILAGTKVKMEDYSLLKEINPTLEAKEIYKAKELSGMNGLHFRMDSLNGLVSVKRSKREVKLNDALH